MKLLPIAAAFSLLTAGTAFATSLEVGKVRFSGEIEAQGYYERHGMQEGKGAERSESKIAIPTLALNADIEVAEKLTGYVSLLWDERKEEDELEVDVATLTYAPKPFSFTVGRMYVPFGDYSTAFVSDPLTVALGQTRESAVMASVDPAEFLSISIFAFNGEAEMRKDGKAPEKDNDWDFGAAIAVRPGEYLALGGSYITDLADSDFEIVIDNLYGRRVAGASLFATLSVGPVKVGGEAVTALDEFETADIEGATGEMRPMAWHGEVAADVTKDVTVALGIDGTREWPGMPEFQLGAIAAYRAFDNAVLSLEYINGVYDAKYTDEHRMERVTIDFDVIF